MSAKHGEAAWRLSEQVARYVIGAIDTLPNIAQVQIHITSSLVSLLNLLTNVKAYPEGCLS
jgi:hypothetical protein